MRFVHSASSRRFGVPWVGLVALMGCSDTAAVPAAKDAGPDAQVSTSAASVDAATTVTSRASSAPSLAEAGASSVVSATSATTATTDASQSVDADASASEPDATLDAEASVMSVEDAGDAGDASDSAIVHPDSETGAPLCEAVGASGVPDAAQADAGASCYPSCIQQLQAACPTTGSCTHSCDGTGAAWESGVTLSTRFEDTPPYTLESTLSLAEVGLCYRVVYESESESYSWFDSCGALVARGTPPEGDAGGANLLNVVCEATGIPELVDLDSSACARYAYGYPGVPEIYYGCDAPAGCEF